MLAKLNLKSSPTRRSQEILLLLVGSTYIHIQSLVDSESMLKRTYGKWRLTRALRKPVAVMQVTAEKLYQGLASMSSIRFYGVNFDVLKAIASQHSTLQSHSSE